MPLEKDYERKLYVWCRKRGHRCEKLTSPVCKGFPDRTVILHNGRVAFIEMKREGGELSEHQKRWVNLLRTMNQDVFVCWDFESARKAIKYLETREF